MNIIIWLIFGALAGWLASKIIGTDHRQGAVMNIVLGIIGAFVGGFLANALGLGGVDGFNLYSLLIAIVGAVVVTWLYSMFTRRTV